MKEHSRQTGVAEGPERTFQGLVVGMTLGILLWLIAILVWMAI